VKSYTATDSIGISAPPDRIFPHLLGDLDHYVMTSEGPLRAGSTFENRAISDRLSVLSLRPVRCTVEVFVPEKRIAWTVHLGREQIRSDWLILPVSESQSRLQLRMDYSARGPWSWFMRSASARAEQTVSELLIALKGQVEAERSSA
jgi:hypothetical protein